MRLNPLDIVKTPDGVGRLTGDLSSFKSYKTLHKVVLFVGNEELVRWYREEELEEFIPMNSQVGEI